MSLDVPQIHRLDCEFLSGHKIRQKCSFNKVLTFNWFKPNSFFFYCRVEVTKIITRFSFVSICRDYISTHPKIRSSEHSQVLEDTFNHTSSGSPLFQNKDYPISISHDWWCCFWSFRRFEFRIQCNRVHHVRSKSDRVFPSGWTGGSSPSRLCSPPSRPCPPTKISGKQ